MAADYDAIIVGAGHNGLVTAGYLARAGLRTLVLEARPIVGGTAASEPFAGATVNICNCDHTTFRTTPVAADLELARFGLRYLDMEPAQVAMAWSGQSGQSGQSGRSGQSAQSGQSGGSEGPGGPDPGTWAQYHDVERTLEELARRHPGEVAGYRRYLRAARPSAELILAAAAEPPSLAGLSRLAVRRRFSGMAALRWSRRSAASVLRAYFSHDAVLGPALVSGPLVWGVSPEQRGTGLGALTYAMRHVARMGRPVGGSGALTEALAAAVTHHGGELRTATPVGRILCTDRGAAGVALADGTEITAPVVVSACDPRRTFVQWLRHPPPGATQMVARWAQVRPADGYESKIDAVVTTPPRLRNSDHDLGSTLAVAPSVADMHRAALMVPTGGILDRPALLVNVPSIPDPSMAPPGRHVLSIEVLLTPYRRPGGWPGSPEPRRWLEVFAGLCEPGFLDTIVDWRAVTPDVYERDFHLPAGHATSFAGGPLAALRNPHPELTRYETAVPGLYLTGAATFPGAGIWGASGRNCAAVVLRRAPGSRVG